MLQHARLGRCLRLLCALAALATSEARAQEPPPSSDASAPPAAPEPEPEIEAAPEIDVTELAPASELAPSDPTIPSDALQTSAEAPAPSRPPLPGAIKVRVEPCATPAFSLDAYARALDIELVAVNIGEASDAIEDAAQLVTLTLSMPGCGDVLRIELQARGQLASDNLRASDFEGIGRERALALATIERLSPLWTRVLEAASRPPPLVELPPAPAPPRPGLYEPEREVHAGFGIGFLGGASYDVRLGIGLRMAPSLWLAFGLGYVTQAGTRLNAEVFDRNGSHAIVVSAQAHSALASLTLEGRAISSRVIRVFVASGIATGVAWAHGEIEGAQLSDRLEPIDPIAPLLFTTIATGLRLELGGGLITTARLEARYAVVGATFSTWGETLVEWIGPGLGAGLAVGYGF